MLVMERNKEGKSLGSKYTIHRGTNLEDVLVVVDFLL